MATYDNLSALDNNMKAHQRYFCSSEPLKYINLKINLSFVGKTYKEKKYSIFTEKGVSLSVPNLNPQKYGINSLTFRGSVLWNSLVPVKLKKCRFLQELCFNKLLLKQNENLLCTCSAHKA